MPLSSQPRRLLITGAYGQLGSDLRAAAEQLTVPVTAYRSRDLDITDADAVAAALADFAATGTPGTVINAAAYTAVDNAETDSDAAYAVNATGPTLLARHAVANGLGLIHISTDYVFPGDGTRPYEPDDATGPKSVYGASKLAGEQGVLAEHPAAQVVRTAWVYGATGANFVKTMCALEAKLPTISVVDDQTGSPTWSADLAAGLLELAAADLPGGILHATNSGATTWYDFTRAIYAELGADQSRVLTTTTAAFPRPAPRPAYSVLSPAAWNAAGLTPLRSWRDALSAAFAAHRADFRPIPA